MFSVSRRHDRCKCATCGSKGAVPGAEPGQKRLPPRRVMALSATWVVRGRCNAVPSWCAWGLARIGFVIVGASRRCGVSFGAVRCAANGSSPSGAMSARFRDIRGRKHSIRRAAPYFDMARPGSPEKFHGPIDGLGVALFDNRVVALGPVGTIIWPRDTNDSSALNGLTGVGMTVNIGGYVDYWAVPWLRSRAEVMQGSWCRQRHDRQVSHGRRDPGVLSDHDLGRSARALRHLRDGKPLLQCEPRRNRSRADCRSTTRAAAGSRSASARSSNIASTRSGRHTTSPSTRS